MFLQRFVNTLLAALLVYMISWLVTRIIEKKPFLQDIYKQKALDKGRVVSGTLSDCFYPEKVPSRKFRNRRIAIYDYTFAGYAFQYKTYVDSCSEPEKTVDLYFLVRPFAAAPYGQIKGTRFPLFVIYVASFCLFYFVVFVNIFS